MWTESVTIQDENRTEGEVRIYNMLFVCLTYSE
jgi:hypothetical protein